MKYIYIYIYIYIYNFCCTKMKKYKFSQEFKKQVSENINFLIKVIYNILCIIKKYIKFENFSFSFKQTFSNQKFSTIKSKTPRNLSKKLIKLNKTTI